MNLLKTIIFSIVLLVLLGNAAGALAFKGNVKKVYPELNLVICKGADLVSVTNNQIIYVCDKSNVPIAALRTIRSNKTTFITVLIAGSIDKIKRKMNISPKLPENSELPRIYPPSQEFSYYWWDVNVIYGMKPFSAARSSTFIFPQKIFISNADGERRNIDVADEVESITIKNLQVSSVLMKNGTVVDIKKSGLAFCSYMVPEDDVRMEGKFGRKTIHLNSETATQIRFIGKLYGVRKKELKAYENCLTNDRIWLTWFPPKPVETPEQKMKYKECEVLLTPMHKSPSQLKKQTEILKALSAQLTTNQRMDLYGEYTSYDNYLAGGLNILFPGLGSYYQKDYLGGHLAVGGAVLAGGLFIGSTVLLNIHLDKTGEAKNASSGTVDDSLSSGFLVAAVLVYITAEIFTLIRPHSYSHSWNKRLGNILIDRPLATGCLGIGPLPVDKGWLASPMGNGVAVSFLNYRF